MNKKESKTCKTCGEEKPFKEFHKSARGIGSCKAHCRVCEFFKRNKSLKIKNDWTLDEYRIIVDSTLNTKIEYINELVSILNNKTLDDIVHLLHYDLIIGNVELKVELPCECCGEMVAKSIGIYINNKNIFCSKECYWKHKKENTPTGISNPDYKRIKTNCDNCNDELFVIPYDYNKENSFGDKHNFCSQECYWEFRGKYYKGSKGSRYGYEPTPSEINKMRIRAVEFYSNGTFNRQTQPQKIANKILDELGIEYENEYNCKYYSIDNYLINYSLMIEVHGDYFHANPLKFTTINDMQYNDIIRDKRKSTYIKRYYKIPILYLWEYDLHNNEELCKKLILYYIKNQGHMKDYNSFNHHVNNDELVLNKSLIKPYMKYTPSELDDIRDNKSLVTFNCDNCDKEVKRYKSQYKLSINHFCNTDCRIEFNKQKLKSIS